MGSLDSVQGITSYYCLTFTAVIHELFVSYLMGIRTSGGFIAYLNGQEINRVRMPDGAVTKDTTATETGSSEFVVAGYSMFTSALVDGENFLCVEVHKRSVRSETNDFDVYVTPQGDARELLVGGTVARSHEGFDSIYWHETWDKVFDKNTNTKFYSDDDDCSDVWFEYTLPNQRKEWVSRAEIWKGNGPDAQPVVAAHPGVEHANQEGLLGDAGLHGRAQVDGERLRREEDDELFAVEIRTARSVWWRTAATRRASRSASG